jgi:putative transposase
MSMQKTFKYRLYPNRRQRLLLEQTLRVCQTLYNDALQERIGAWKTCRKSISYHAQANQLPACKEADASLVAVHSQVLQDVLRRIDKTFKAFFRRGRGFPRFRSRHRYDSFTYPQAGFALGGRHLQLAKIGNVKIKLHRPLKGQARTLTIKRENGMYYACFSVVLLPEPLPANGNAVGIDVGLESFAVTSNGEVLDNPRWYRRAQKRLRRAQRKVSRRVRDSHRRRKAIRLLAKLHKHVFNQRHDFQHKSSHEIVRDNGAIFVEDLNLKGLAGGMLAKSVHDVGWGSFINKLSYKAECAGRWFEKIDPRGTSQRCPCGNPVPKKLSHRVHRCLACGLNTARDHASALEILRLGLSLQAPSTGSTAVLA